MVDRFSAHEQGSWLERKVGPTRTFRPSAAWTECLVSALARPSGMRSLQLHAPLDRASVGALAAGLTAHGAALGTLRELDLRYTTVGADWNAFALLGTALGSLSLEVLSLAFGGISAWPASVLAYFRQDTSLQRERRATPNTCLKPGSISTVRIGSLTDNLFRSPNPVGLVTPLASPPTHGRSRASVQQAAIPRTSSLRRAPGPPHTHVAQSAQELARSAPRR